MKSRTLIRSMKLPDGSDARALAESLTEAFNVASISGSKGEYEVQFVSPAELVAVISPSRARFFVEEPDDEDEDEDLKDGHGDDDEDEDPNGVAEEICNVLAYRLGKRREEKHDESDVAVPDDDSDRIARKVMTRLLDEGLLELVTPRSRHSVEKHLAHCIAHGKSGATLCDDLADLQGVAELYVSDEELDAIVAACRKKPAATNPLLAALAAAGSKSAAKPSSKAPTSERTKPRADVPKARKSKP